MALDYSDPQFKAVLLSVVKNGKSICFHKCPIFLSTQDMADRPLTNRCISVCLPSPCSRPAALSSCYYHTPPSTACPPHPPHTLPIPPLPWLSSMASALALPSDPPRAALPVPCVCRVSLRSLGVHHRAVLCKGKVVHHRAVLCKGIVVHHRAV